MVERTHALISLKPRHAIGILDGTKRVELRRRPMNVRPGATLWLYVKVPVGMVVGTVQVVGSHHLAPTALWRNLGSVSGLSRTEFFEYFAGSSKAFALVLERPRRLRSGVHLDELRRLAGGFQPPQFFQHLEHESPLLATLLGESLARPMASSGGGGLLAAYAP